MLGKSNQENSTEHGAQWLQILNSSVIVKVLDILPIITQASFLKVFLFLVERIEQNFFDKIVTSQTQSK